MERTQIYLSKEESDALERQSEATGLTKSHLIREAIDQVYLTTQPPDFLEALERSRGLWKGRQETGTEYVKRMRPGLGHKLRPSRRARRR